MPNRMLRDWTASDKINSLSVYAERFFIRLIMKADDFGCFYADSRLLKANLFPLLIDTIREADLLRWMAECQKAGLIVLYESSSKRYLQIVDFRQRLDRAKSKFPLPGANDFPAIVNDFPPEQKGREAEEEPEQNPREEFLKSLGDPQPFSKQPEFRLEIIRQGNGFAGEDFIRQWVRYLDWRVMKDKAPIYMDWQSQEVKLRELHELTNKPGEAIKIIQQTIANGNTSFYALKKSEKVSTAKPIADD